MKTRLLVWASWITFLVSAISEWGLDIDLPLTPALWLVMTAVVFFATNAPAALTTNSWTSSSGGKWEIGSNWSPAVTPTNNALTFVTNTTTKTVTIDAPTVLSNAINSCLTISNLILSAPGGMTNVLLLSDPGTNVPLRILNFVSISSGGLLVISNGAVQADSVSGTDTFRDDGQVLLNSPAARLIETNSTVAIGYSGQGMLTMSNGFILTSGTTVGRTAGSQGTLTIAGGTNQFTSAGFLTVGDSAGAAGWVWVTGGRLDVPSTSASVIGHFSDGQMTVSNGTVSIGALTVGSSAAGTLTLAGGTNAVASFFIVGGGTSKTGAVWLTGGQLLTTNSAQTTLIGNGGVGQLTMSNGTWQGHRAILGNSLGAQGTLTIAGGTNEFSASLSIGEETNSTGAVWVTDTGRLVVTNASTFIGARGTGQMTISNGTLLANSVLLATNTTATGTLTVAGGTLACVGPVVIGSATSTGWLTVTNGQFTITNTPVTATGVSTGLFVDGSVTVSNGTIHVPSSLVSIGNHGVGSLTVHHGSNDMLSLDLGEFTGSTGTLTMNGGTNSIFSDFTLGKGSASTGTIWFNGDRLDTGSANIGWDGVGIMSMSGGVWRATGPVNVGQLNRGTLTVAGGTMIVDAAALVVPHGSTLNGTVWLTGGQVIATNSLVSLGEAGGGILTVSNALLSARDVYIATNASSTGVGTLTVAAGTNNVYRSLIVGANNCVGTGAVNVAGGRLFVTNATTTALLEVRSGTVTLNSGTLTIDKLVMTNGCGHFIKTGGTLSITSTNIDPNFDTDGDGFSNQQEAIGGSDPFDPTSIPPPQFITSWNTTASGKWENDGNWSAGAPSLVFTNVYVTNATTKVVTIDATTTNAAATMTISNLLVAGPLGTINTLQLTNAGTTALRVLNTFTIGSGGSVLVTNSPLRVENGPLTINGAIANASMTVRTNGSVAVVGPVTIGGGPISTGLVLVTGGQLVVTNNPTVVSIGSLTANNGMIIDGSITLTNGGSLVVSNVDTLVGNHGSGNLVNLGGSLLVKAIHLGETAGSGGTFTAAGGTNRIAGQFLVGNGSGATGTVWQTGSTSQIISTNGIANRIGYFGTGQMTVSNGTWLADFVTVGFSEGGTLTLAGGTNTILGSLEITGGLTTTGTVWITGSATELVTTNAVSQLDWGQMIISNGTWLAGDVNVGSSSQGTLTVAGGTNSLFSLDVAFGVGSTGAVWVTGGQLAVTNSSTSSGAFIGDQGVGQMTVSNGTWLANVVTVGNGLEADGTLTLVGGTSILGNRMTIGGSIIPPSGPGTGTVWLTGGQLVMTNSDVYVGDTGVGRMTVSNGLCLVRSIGVGDQPGSQGTLTIAGGTTTLPFGLAAGITAGSTGTIWMTGGQLTMTNGELAVGFYGVGRMTMSNGTLAADYVVIAAWSASQGTLTLAGGTSSVYSNLTIGGSPCLTIGTVGVAGGSLFVSNATGNAVLEVDSGSLTLNSGTLMVNQLVITNSCGHFVRTGGTLIQNNPPNLGAGLDADGDGLPNDWEQAHGLDPLDPTGNNGAAGDPDGDGITNLQEFQSGTDPQNPSSTPFRITSIVQQGNDVLLTWTTLAGTTNQVQATNGSGGNFATNGFANLSGQMFIGGSGVVTTNYTDTNGATNSPARYYRIRLVP